MTTVLESILAATNDARVRLSMALGAMLEGGSLGAGPFPAGDSGSSLGPFQIHLPAHPGVSGAQAQDPKAATAFMLSEYVGAAKKIPDSLWASNPQQAAEKTAMLAERPAKDYYTSRPGAVETAWATVTKLLGSGTGKPGSSSTAGGVDNSSGATAADPSLFGIPGTPSTTEIASTVTHAAIVVVAVAAGAGLVLLGVNKAAGWPGVKAGKAAAGAIL